MWPGGIGFLERGKHFWSDDALFWAGGLFGLVYRFGFNLCGHSFLPAIFTICRQKAERGGGFGFTDNRLALCFSGSSPFGSDDFLASGKEGS